MKTILQNVGYCPQDVPFLIEIVKLDVGGRTWTDLDMT
jgi:hypothetical protein